MRINLTESKLERKWRTKFYSREHISINQGKQDQRQTWLKVQKLCRILDHYKPTISYLSIYKFISCLQSIELHQIFKQISNNEPPLCAHAKNISLRNLTQEFIQVMALNNIPCPWSWALLFCSFSNAQLNRISRHFRHKWSLLHALILNFF